MVEGGDGVQKGILTRIHNVGRHGTPLANPHPTDKQVKMPAISKGDTVLVTGASGFIAVYVATCRTTSDADIPSQVVKDLLESGYKVKGTVRSDAKGQYLKDLFKGQPFEYVLVDDITKVSHAYLVCASELTCRTASSMRP